MAVGNVIRLHADRHALELRRAAAAAVSAYRCAVLGISDKSLGAAVDDLETQLETFDAQHGVAQPGGYEPEGGAA